MKKYIFRILTGLVVLFLGFMCYSSIVIESGPDLVFFSKTHKWDNPAYADYLILVDFSRPSMEDRLFIYDGLKSSEPIHSGVVLHGCGEGNTPSTPKFSNEPGSNCSSLGDYTLEGLTTMSDGMEAIKLKGWSVTNSNVESRGILIHPSKLASSLLFNIPGANFPLSSASKGCFAVSYRTFDKIKQCMNDSKSHKVKLVAYYKSF